MNALIRRGPAREFDLLRREMDRLFDTVGSQDREQAVWAPRADIQETDGSYSLALDLPGIDREDLDITFEDGTLKISGERRVTREDDSGRFHRVERQYGRFFRSFTLGPDIDADGIEADMVDGVLELRVPKAETVQPRRIEIGSRRRANASTNGEESLAETSAA